MGYSFCEVGLSSVESKLDPKEIKTDLRVLSPKTDDLTFVEKIPVSRTLPIYCRTAAEPICDPNCIQSVVLGSVGRFGAKTPLASKLLLGAMKKFTRRFCELNLDRLRPGDAEFDDWIANTPYTAERRAQLKAV